MHRRWNRRTGSLAFTAALLWLLLAFAPVATETGRAGEAAALRPATLMLDWTPNTNHTGIYVALAKGWYSEQGLDLQVIAPGGSASVESVVGAGRANFGISFQEWVTSARIEGVPIVSIAAVLQHNTSGFASLKSAGIKRPADFAGKRYGGYGLPIEQAVLQGLMRADGGDPTRVRYVNAGATDLLTLLTQKAVDLVWIYYGWQGIEAGLRGIDLNTVMLSDHTRTIPDYYTPVIITSEALIARSPDLVRAFATATARGYEFAVANPAEAATILSQYAPEANPELVRRSQAWLSPRYAAGAPRWGYQKAEVWQGFGDWMYKNGLITKPFDGRAAFTNAFLPK